MKIVLICLALTATTLLSTAAADSPLDDKVAALKKAMTDELELHPGDSSSSSSGSRQANPQMAPDALGTLMSQMNSPNSANIEVQLEQLLSEFNSESVNKAGQALLVEMQAEQKANAEAAVGKMKDLLSRTSKMVNEAKAPEDLDGILQELQKFENDQMNAYTPEGQSLHQQVSGALDFTKLWQSYLSHRATKQGQLAYEDLQALLQNNYGMTIIPRSRILAMLAPKPGNEQAIQEQPKPERNYEVEAYQIVGDVQKLDDLEPAYKKLQDLDRSGHFTQAYAYLKPVVETYQNVRDGMSTNAAAGLSSDTHDALRPEVHKQLLLFVLQHLFNTYKGATPTATETPGSYVDRVIQDAAKQQDWNLLKQGLTAYNYLHTASKLSQSDAQDALSGLDQLSAGMNQEDADQYSLAVASYQNALKQLPASLVPPKMIGDRLAAIRTNHPTDYDQGMLLFLAPPMSHTNFNGIPGYGMPGYGMPGYGMPGFPPTRPSLNIPGTSQPTSTPSGTPSTNAPSANQPANSGIVPPK